MALRAERDRLEAVVLIQEELNRQQDQRLNRTRLEFVCRLGSIAEFRDDTTGRHVFRVGHSPAK